MKVKELREKYGIHDSRNEYTEEQLTKLSQQKIYYITYNREYGTKNVQIEYKHVFGYISEDESACIFVKDSSITGKSDSYMPKKQLRFCKEIKEGIYHEKVDDVIYCTTEELQFCLDYAKEYVKTKIQEEIIELEQELLKLRSINIVFKHIK